MPQTTLKKIRYNYYLTGIYNSTKSSIHHLSKK